ncbi:hypothetical protein ACHAPJ_005823 [Fusarium lateritium]
MRTTDFPSWFWLPLRDDCEWDSIFTMHNCFDDEYNGFILAALRLIFGLFYDIPTFFLLVVVFICQDNLTNKYIISLVTITAFPIIFTPMIWAEEYELHAEQTKPFFWELRRGWFALAAPSLGLLLPKVIFLTSQAYQMAQEILIWGRDYVNNNLDLEIVFPDPPGGDIMSPNPDDTRAEAWMKRLMQEERDRQKARQDEKDKETEAERQKEEAVLREKQREQDEISRIFKFSTNRGKQPPERLYTRNRNPSPPSPSLIYEPSTTEDGEYSHISIRIRDVDEARGKKVRKYVHKSTQTDPFDLTVKGSARPIRKGYVDQSIQTDPSTVKDEIALPATVTETVPETVPETPKPEPKLPETKLELPETKVNAPKVEPEVEEETSESTSKGKDPAGPEPTVNSHLAIVPEAPTEEQEPPQPEPSTASVTIPPQPGQSPTTAIPITEPTEPAQVPPEQTIPLPESPVVRPSPKTDKTDSPRRKPKSGVKKGPRRHRTLVKTPRANLDRLVNVLQLELETKSQESRPSTIVPRHTQESFESTTSVPSNGHPTIPDPIYQPGFEHTTEGLPPPEEPITPKVTQFNPFAEETIPPTQSAAPEVAESWPSTEEVVSSQPDVPTATDNDASTTSAVELQDDPQVTFTQSPSDVLAPEPSATLPPLDFQPFSLSTEIQEVTNPLGASQSSNTSHSALDPIPSSLLFDDDQGHQPAPAILNATEAYNSFNTTPVSNSHSSSSLIGNRNIEASLDDIIGAASIHHGSESESHENDMGEEVEEETEPEPEPEGESEMTDRQEDELEELQEPQMQTAIHYGSDEEMTEVDDAQQDQQGLVQDVNMNGQDEQEVVAPQEATTSQDIEMGEDVQELAQERIQEHPQEHPQEHIQQPIQQHTQEQLASQSVRSALAALEHVEVKPKIPTEEEQERITESMMEYMDALDELEDPEDAEFRNNPTDEPVQQTTTENSTQSQQDHQLTQGLPSNSTVPEQQTVTSQPPSIQPPPAATTQPGTEAREGPRNGFSYVPSQDALVNSPFFSKEDPYAKTALGPTMVEDLDNMDRYLQRAPAAPQPPVFRFPELGTVPSFQNPQFPNTQGGPSQTSQQNTQATTSDNSQMSQTEQDELERDMAAAFEDDNVSQADTVVHDDPENETSSIPYLELYAQSQAAAGPSLPTSLPPHSPPHSPGVAPPYIPVNTIIARGTPGYVLDPPKAATEEQLSKRKILKLKHEQQQQERQQSAPQQVDHANDAAVMDEAAMNLLRLAQGHEIAITGNIPPELMISSTQATTSIEPATGEQSTTTVQPTTSTQASSQQQQSVPGSTTQSTSTQGQPSTSNVQRQADPSDVQAQQPPQQPSQQQPQQQAPPMQTGGLVLPGGNPVMSGPSTPAGPAAPQGTQGTGPQPDPRAEAFRKKKAEELKGQREAKKNTKPSLFHASKKGGTSSTPGTPRPSTPSTPRQNPGPSTQPSAPTDEDENMQ